MDLFAGIKFLPAASAALLIALASGCEKPSSLDTSSPNVKHITQGEFGDEVTRAGQPVAVEFYATWCGPCREMGALLDRVAGGYDGKIKFVKVNVDESPGLAQNYEVQAIPTLILFKDDKLANRITGLPAEPDLKTKLDALVAAK
jgi:thioredoxin 1